MYYLLVILEVLEFRISVSVRVRLLCLALLLGGMNGMRSRLRWKLMSSIGLRFVDLFMTCDVK